jgi:hypothetical protein
MKTNHRALTGALSAGVVCAAVVFGWSAPLPGPKAQVRDSLAVCRELARLKNEGDPKARRLLPPPPPLPQQPITEAEAARLDAAIILQRDFKVNKVTPLPSTARDELPRFVLWLRGNVCSETLDVRTADGKVERGVRVLTNPDVIVEVRDGIIYGVKAMLHEDAPTRRR